MGFIGSLLSGSKGAGFQASGTPMIGLTDAEQIQQQQGNVNSGLAQQQNFLNALGTQGGLRNQDVVFNQQQQLANQLQGVANGTGPNPAQQALANATGSNVANQAALMAGQRGAGANSGLLARQAAMQGASVQQQAAGQGALLQAQQQIAAMQALQGQQANMANLASTQVGQQLGALGQYNQFAQGAQQNALGAGSAMNNANVAMQSNINSSNAHVAGANAGAQAGILGGLGSAAMSLFDKAGKGAGSPGGGGLGGGSSSTNPSDGGGGAGGGPWAGVGAGDGGGGGDAGLGDSGGQGGSSDVPLTEQPLYAAHGGMIPANGPASKAGQWLKGCLTMQTGGPVPGKAPMPGKDSLKNDVVSAKLSPGEIVVPLSHASDPEKAAQFARAVAMKNQRKGKK